MSAEPPVVIAGGGIGGLTLALALARRGIPVEVLERAPALAEIGAGLQLSPNACRVLDRLGLGPALDRVAIEPDWLRMRDGRSGEPVASLPLGRAQQRWGAPYRLVHRADLQDILHAAATAAGAVIRLDCGVIGFEDRGVEGVAVTCSQGSVAGRALVGADGIGSALRGALGDGSAAAVSGTAAWRALVPAARWPHGVPRSEVTLWMGAGGHLVAYPLRGGELLNVVACIPARHRTAGSADVAVLRRFFARWAPAVRALPDAAAWSVTPLCDRPPGYGTGRGAVVLIGDAAHPALPHLAQGAALAIEDAAVLAARLAAGPNDLERMFRRFEQGRSARVARVQREARRNGRIYGMGPISAAARDLALRAMGPELLLGRLDWLYGWGRRAAT
jgi:salicylate hydroxylase